MRTGQPDNVIPIRPLPHDAQAEKALLGTMMMGQGAVIPQIREILEPADFYIDNHGILAEALMELGEDADFVTLKRLLLQSQSEGLAAELVMLIAQLADQVSTTAGWRHWANIVKDLSNKRKILQEAQRAADLLRHPAADLDEAVMVLREGILSLDRREAHPTPRQIADEVWNDLERRMQTQNQTMGVQTGFSVVDQHTGGLEPGCTYYLTGRSHSGKSALALHLADNVAAANPGALTLYLTLESQAIILTRRRMARMSGISLTRIRLANIRDDWEWEQLNRAMDTLQQDNLWIVDDTALCDYSHLTGFCEAQALKRDVSLLVVDHLQKLRLAGNYKRDDIMWDDISSRLNDLAKNLQVPVLVLSQVNEDGEARGSRMVYANADNEWRIEREDRESEEAKLICTKGKDSGLWRTTLHFDRYRMRFSEQGGGGA